jgi:hypothetical protein
VGPALDEHDGELAARLSVKSTFGVECVASLLRCAFEMITRIWFQSSSVISSPPGGG